MRSSKPLAATWPLEHGCAVGVLSLERDRGLLRRAHPGAAQAGSASITVVGGNRCRESVDGEGGRYGGV